jgi:hypothetical protein
MYTSISFVKNVDKDCIYEYLNFSFLKVEIRLWGQAAYPGIYQMVEEDRKDPSNPDKRYIYVCKDIFMYTYP